LGFVVLPTVRDVDAIRAFIVAAWRQAGPEALGWAGATENNIQEISSEGFISSLLSNPETKVFAFSQDGRIVGIAVNRKMDESTVELAGIMVQQDATGKGIGTALLKTAITSAKDLGFLSMRVKTETNNQHAVSFYRKNGFTELGTGEEEVDGKAVKVVNLALSLKP
jgi:ribosomal protein S18 acetylase RimI-like enzyme